MPVKIPSTLPARATLESENIFVMGHKRAQAQDIRPMRVAILNLMPTKIETETQLLRLLGNSPLQVEITLLQTATYQPKNTNKDHLLAHYRTWEKVKNEKFDGLIITGAPIEHLPFEEVEYWDELTAIMDWAETNVYSSLYVCWGAQAALYHRYQIPKYPLPQKVFGVFEHKVLARNEKLLRGFDDIFMAPHSRYTEVSATDIRKIHDLRLLAVSEEAGVYLAISHNGRHVFVTGHSEYDPLTLKGEYDRDVNQGKPINVPKNYYPNDDPSRPPQVRWRSHANLLYANWLNYYVYQVTPYNIKNIPNMSPNSIS
ncbi:MAG: homoserine O-succinyltransferase [Anaerolineae bacterium]|nr:homoserine O-succinyltransferase [Anaerolineae bacterium]